MLKHFKCDPVKAHGSKNVWSGPRIDTQYILAPTEISKYNGDIGTTTVGDRQFVLPKQGKYFNVFTFGGLPTSMVAMESYMDSWVSAEYHCNTHGILIDVYNNAGIHFPLNRTWFLYNRAGHLIVALERTRDIFIPKTGDLFIRWRTGNWFRSNENNDTPIKDVIKVRTFEMTNKDALYEFENAYQQVKELEGGIILFLNGKVIHAVDFNRINTRDIFWFVYDRSIKEEKLITLKSLKSFRSEMDDKRKYLLSLGDGPLQIEYHDDIDVYIRRYNGGTFTGVYYHQNHEDSIRNLTHRDYSVPAAYISGVLEKQGWKNTDDIRLVLVIRRSGIVRPLPYNNNRIRELYKLSEKQRSNAMLGEKAAVGVWQASNLESSPLMKLMSAECFEITNDLVRDSYGYWALSRILGDTPQKISPTTKWQGLPFSHYYRSTVYEYDNSGFLLGRYLHDVSDEYPVRNQETRYLESYIGWGGNNMGTVINVKSHQLEKQNEYRFYVSSKVGSKNVRGKWFDVTGDEEFIKVDKDNLAEWQVDLDLYDTAIRKDCDFLSIDIELDYKDNLLVFSVLVDEVYVGRGPLSGLMEVPPGHLDVFLNDAHLIEDIDYHVNWPEICIVNKKFTKPNSKQKVHIRARGFCTKDMKREKPEDIGFVANGMVSYNKRYDLRDDRVIVGFVGGGIYSRDELMFSEDGTAKVMEHLNGLPYAIYNPIVPLKDFVDADSYDLRTEALKIDKEVQAYLNLHLPEKRTDVPSLAKNLYRVISPFATKIIYDMINNHLPLDDYNFEYTDEWLRERLKGYDWILQYDPCILGVDEEWMEIHPHPEKKPIELNPRQYKVLADINRLFLNNKLDINRHVVFIESGFEHEQVDHPHPKRLWSEI